MGGYDGFCNSYLSQEEEENASVKIAKWLILVPDKCCPLAEVVCKSSDGQELLLNFDSAFTCCEIPK